MHLRSKVQILIQTVLSPQKIKICFGSCESACTDLGLEKHIDKPKPIYLRLHFLVCRPCWLYKNQIEVINKKMVENLRALSEIDTDLVPSQIAQLISKYSR